MIIGIITNALYAKFATEVKQIEEQVQLKQIMSDSSYTGSINDLLGFDSDYNNKLIVQEGNLVYVSDEVSSQEVKWLEKLGIEKASDYFTVEFDTGGGTEISSQLIKAGQFVKKPTNPIKTGHDFLGWYYLKQGGSETNPTYTEIEFNFNTNITNNYSLYAKYSGEAVMMARNDDFAFWQEEYRTKITDITFKQNEIMVPDTAIESWDVRTDMNCSEVRAYIEDNGNFGYKLVIVSPNTIYANSNPINYFKEFTNMTTIDFSNFDTSKAINMYAMFNNCTNLNNLDVSNFNTKNVVNMALMFGNCSKLITLDLSNFNTSKVKYMYNMFGYCQSLQTLDITNFNTTNVTSMAVMFWSCSNLESLNISNFDTSNVSSMSRMFRGCSSLSILDLSNFNTQKVTSMEGMFSFARNLTTVYIGNEWTTENADTTAMLSGCNATIIKKD